MPGRSTNSLRLNGNPNWYPGMPSPSPKGNPQNLTKKAVERRKIFSSWLIEFYSANPKRLKKVMMQAIARAEKGESRFLELIVQLVEGPLKAENASGDTYNFNFLSDAERERITGSVLKIKAMMQAKQLTEAIDVKTQSLETYREPSSERADVAG